MDRRSFLLSTATLAGGAAAGAGAFWRWQELPVRLHAPGQAEGHRLRDAHATPPITEQLDTDVLILGSGIAGLTAAWRLARSGHERFMMVSGPEWQGNAAAGAEGELRYPTGAHYLPLPSMESTHVREMLQDLGMLLRNPDSTHPTYDERALIHAPQERLFLQGRWEDSLLMPSTLPEAEKAQIDRFFAYVETLKAARGQDGRPLFAIPLTASSADPSWTALDRMRFTEWLSSQGYDAPHLLWYLDYGCRDDYGRSMKEISAWAGLHYFCARTGHAANAESGTLLTWPQGLAAIADGLAARARLSKPGRLFTGMATRIQHAPDGVHVTCVRQGAGLATHSTLIRAHRVICALPLFVASRIYPEISALGFDPAQHMPSYAPWLVSNFVMTAFPREAEGVPLAWDNVVRSERGLGWVVNTHQDIRQSRPERTVFTAYEALSDMRPKAARAWLQSASASALLERAGHHLREAYGWALAACCERVDITLRGHAMAIPQPGYLANSGLKALREADGPVLFAHSDLSGYSIFEEAAWWGDRAARLALG